ncbi:MAG: hypothetical protein JWQ28_911 [Pedobacter sp.]|jgi:hypothetical protein|nr:hypothetical protein [Pedobacter sp.]
MKTQKLLFWITTGIIVLFEGVLPLFTFNTEMAKEGLRHLGYPAYFGSMLVAFKILGVIALAVPKTPARIKEWAYAGFGFDFIAASVSHSAVDGFGFQAIFPLIFFVLLVVSYINYHKLAVHGKADLAYN